MDVALLDSTIRAQLQSLSMEDKINRARFLQIFRDELMNENIDFNMEFRGIASWTSLNSLIVLSRLNDEFQVVIKSRDLLELSTIEDIFHFSNKR